MRRLMLSVGVLVLAVSMPVAADQSEIVGHWDITATVTPEKIPMWLGVKDVDGKLTGEFLNHGGSVLPVDAISYKDSVVKFTFTCPWSGTKYHFTGQVKGDTITGTRNHEGRKGKKGKEIKWVAKRFVRNIDVSGQWLITKEAKNRKSKVTMTLTQKGKQISGTFSQKKWSNFDDAKLEKGTLTFSAMRSRKKDKSPEKIVLSAQVKGDTLDGTITRPNGKKMKFTAQRQRQWGKPVELFNGKNLDGWKPIRQVDKNNWKAIDGVLSNSEAGSDLLSTHKFQDFKIHVEFKVPEESNSGVYLRGRYEIQIDDNYGNKPRKGGCGAIYSRIIPLLNAAKPADEWQTFDATLIGSYVTVRHNGQLIIDNQELEGITGGALDCDEAASGPVYLQGDHGPIYYRKLTITPALSASAPEGS